MDLIERFNAPGPKRILALDGGGIRGAITAGFLEEIERVIRERHGDDGMLLSDYFDLIGGTSTGSIIAAGLASGMSAREVTERYLEFGGEVFSKRKLRIWEALYSAEPLDKQLRKFFGNRQLGDPEIRTGLCIVTKRADTNSVWPLINHPNGKYYPKNRGIPLRQAVRASTAAPVAFVPEQLDVGGGEFGAFVDGGVSMANNPSLQLLLVATLQGFPFRWATGERELLLVSVGTGRWESTSNVDEILDGGALGLVKQATRSISMLMGDASAQNELLLQAISRSPTRRLIDREIGDLGGETLVPEPLLTYLRYNAELEAAFLQEHGFGKDVHRLDSLRNMAAAGNREILARIGRTVASKQVMSDHFPAAFDVPTAARSMSAIGMPLVPHDAVAGIAAIIDPVQRNRAITLFYHDIAVRLSRIIGGPDVTWFGFGTWASRTAGGFVSGEAIPRWSRQLMSDAPHRPVGRAAASFADDLRKQMADGNTLVFEEIAPIALELADVIARGHERALDRLLATLRAGESCDGGQDLLGIAFRAWFAAAHAESANERAELVLLGNLAAVYHEQQRLQPILESSLRIPILGALLGADDSRPGSLVGRTVLAAVRQVAAVPSGEWRRFVTRFTMQYELPASSVRVGRDVERSSRDRAYPAELERLTNQDLVELWGLLAGNDNSVRDSAASDWSQLASRMRFVATLFRTKQQERGLLALPYRPEEALAIRSGYVSSAVAVG